MDRACRTHERGVLTGVLVETPRRERSAAKIRPRLECRNKTDWYELHLARLRAVVDAVKNLRVPFDFGNLLSSWASGRLFARSSRRSMPPSSESCRVRLQAYGSAECRTVA
jgi:hypothetical protein